MRRVCVFCGSNRGGKEAYAAAARAMGESVAAYGLGLVYGGGGVGLMAVVADGALARGGSVIGVIPRRLMRRELGHPGVTELRVVDSMHERKAMMAELADAFVALPGGFGTFEEFFEVLTWAQLGIHAKPCGLLNVAGYYDPLLEMVERATGEGFVREGHRGLIQIDDDPERLLTKLQAYVPPVVEKWLDSGET